MSFFSELQGFFLLLIVRFSLEMHSNEYKQLETRLLVLEIAPEISIGNIPNSNNYTLVIKQTFKLQKFEAPILTLGVLFRVLNEHYVQV